MTLGAKQNSTDSTVDILLVDDDHSFTKLVHKYLSDAGFSVAVCHSGLAAVDYVAQQTPRLIVLDVMMPELDGLQTCKQVRSHYHGPILMLTALDEEVDEIIGLELGADDYLRKPISPRLLLARVRTQLRRDEFAQNKCAQHAPGQQEAQSELDNAANKQVLSFGGLELNLYSRSVRSSTSKLELTDLEFDLLAYLLAREGQIISRDQLYQDTVRIAYDGLDRTLDLRVSRLRKKLNEDLAHRVLIKTIRNQGYMLSLQDDL